MEATIEWFTPQEIAEKLKVHLNTVYRWIDTGKLKASKAGDLLRISSEELNAFLKSPAKEE